MEVIAFVGVLALWGIIVVLARIARAIETGGADPAQVQKIADKIAAQTKKLKDAETAATP